MPSLIGIVSETNLAVSFSNFSPFDKNRPEQKIVIESGKNEKRFVNSRPEKNYRIKNVLLTLNWC